MVLDGLGPLMELGAIGVLDRTKELDHSGLSGGDGDFVKGLSEEDHLFDGSKGRFLALMPPDAKSGYSQQQGKACSHPLGAEEEKVL